MRPRYGPHDPDTVPRAVIFLDAHQSEESYLTDLPRQLVEQRAALNTIAHLEALTR